MAELNREKLMKIVALAKRGEGGEKETALRIVRKICVEHNLDFDEVMGDGEKIEPVANNLFYQRQHYGWGATSGRVTIRYTDPSNGQVYTVNF